MAGTDVFELIQRFRAEGRPFCLATVVRTADLTSAKAGAKAVVTSEGQVIGHLGGGCVLGAVRHAASQVMETGTARMITVQPEDATLRGRSAVEVHISGCPSGGTVELFIEPFLQPFRICVLGDGPIAKALRAHAALMGFAVLDGADGQLSGDAVVIASQGKNDLRALREALKSSSAIVAMVASHLKADHLKNRLRNEGMDQKRLEKLISPAGLDIGAIGPHEIAISILAQLVQERQNDRHR
jgi:xanthine dehydrogenase accessory factor